MKKVISFLLALTITITLCVPSVFAYTDRPGSFGTAASGLIYDTDSASALIPYVRDLSTPISAILPSIIGSLAPAVFVNALDVALSSYGMGEIPDDGKLEQLASNFERRYFTLIPLQGGVQAIADFLGVYDGLFDDVEVAYDPTYDCYRLRDVYSGLWLVSENGLFPYYKRAAESAPSTSLWKWIPFEEAKANYKLSSSYTSESELLRAGSCANFNLGEDRQYTPALWKKSVSTEEGVEYPIYYLSSPSESAAVSSYVLTYDGQIVNYLADPIPLAVDTPFEYFETPNDDNQYDSGDTTLQQLIDLSGFSVNFIDNSESITNAYYDMADRSYHVTTNYYDYTNNFYYEYNYEFNYHINYTNVTYIGTTAEYTETYEYYYQLPDGRSSADLTVEELQALNTNIDVIPYIRSADDVSIRALYHFDGDTLDSSYWSYAGNFGWDEGASITYMDAGAFNGALYLDENPHSFHIQLPSNMGSTDFTLQFRYYQSYTATPVSDSKITIGTADVATLDGDAITFNGTAYPVSVGNWQEFCFMRSGNLLYLFHNGVPLGSPMAFSGTYGDNIQFVFGGEQQTYKYFDELRVTSKALYDPTTGYTPTSVPFDTNLALVLPDSKLPIADAYWDISSSKENLLTEPGLDHWINVGEEKDLFFTDTGLTVIGRPTGGGSQYWVKSATPPYAFVGKSTFFNSSLTGSSITNDSSSGWTGLDYGSTRVYRSNSGNIYGNVPSYGLIFDLAYKYGSAYAPVSPWLDASKNYTFSMVFADGSSGSFTFNPVTASSGMIGDYVVKVLSSDAEGLRAGSSSSGWRLGSIRYSLVIRPSELDQTGSEFVYMELVEGDSTDLTAEYVESVVVMDKDDLNTPSLAVRTDINITGYQIGGVRPSLPTKGLVWALVEDGLITSLQIYNGQAWEAVDGRIWTGSRWVPYYAYDVILLKDLYDIVESDPSLDYIYTESGFWKWLQGAWENMMNELRLIRQGVSSGGSGSGTINPDPDDPDFPDSESPSGEKWTIIDLVGGAGSAIWTVTTGFVNVCIDGVGGLVSVTTNAGSFFEAFDPASDSGIFAIFTYDGEPLLGGELDGSGS